jgi:hypothetical protein
MRRRLLPWLCLVSLLSCAALSTMWVRSYWCYDAIGFWPDPAAPRAFGLLSDGGTLCFAALTEGHAGQPHFAVYSQRAGRLQQKQPRYGFLFDRSGQGTIIGAPYWLLCPAAGGITIMLAFRARSARRQWMAEGHCEHCGYDLRATPERCPECGAVPATRQAALRALAGGAVIEPGSSAPPSP